MRISDWSSDVCSSDLQLFDRELQRHPCAGNGGGAGAAIGLDHVAVDRDLPLTKRFKIDDGAQRAADQPLDFLRPARLLALGRLAIAAREIGGASWRERVCQYV